MTGTLEPTGPYIIVAVSVIGLAYAVRMRVARHRHGGVTRADRPTEEPAPEPA